MTPTVNELLAVHGGLGWLPWAVQYFFLIGLSIGCVLLSMTGFVLDWDAWRKTSRLALLGALACGLAAPVALLCDLHQPARFINFYLYPQASSWMSRGSFFIPLYMTGLVLYAWMCLRPDLADCAGRPGPGRAVYRLLGGPAPRALVGASALLVLVGGVLMALYTGFEVMAVAARPLWHTPLLPLAFFATALAGANGLVLLFNRTVGDGDREVEAQLNRLLVKTVGFVLLVAAGWLALGLSGADAIIAQAQADIAPVGLFRWLMALGAVLSVGPLLLAAKAPRGSGWLTGLGALALAWGFRWAIVIDGQSIPKTGAGTYAYRLPLGDDGLLALLGPIGLWLFLLVVLTAILPLPARPAVLAKGV